MENLLSHNFEVRYIKGSENAVADYLSRLISNSAEAPDYPRLLRSYRMAAGFVRILDDDDQYDFDLLQMAEKGGSDTEYCALIRAIKRRQLPPTTP